MSITKKGWSFKEKYDTDPDFKKKHIKYCVEKLKCECGCMVMRSNLSTHRKSKKHLHIVSMLQKNDESDDENDILSDDENNDDELSDNSDN